MALYYGWGWDFGNISAHSVKVTDSATFEVTFSSGLYAHFTDTSIVEHAEFAAAFETALNTGSGGARTYDVTFQFSSGYTISATGGNFSLSFTTTTTAANGPRMRSLLGMSGNRSGAATYSSQVRPLYMAIPAIVGRSEVSDDYEPDGIASEAVADDGTARLIAPATAEKWCDWVQVGDQDQPTTAYTAFGTGTPLHKRYVTSDVPWSYEHAWEHHRAGYDPIVVLQDDALYFALRAEGASFHPIRMGGADFDLWSIPWKTRVLGHAD